MVLLDVKIVMQLVSQRQVVVRQLHARFLRFTPPRGAEFFKLHEEFTF